MVRNVVMLAVVTCWPLIACGGGEPPATAGQYCATVSASLAQLTAPAIVDSAGIDATTELYRSITSIAPLAVQKEWQTMTSNVEVAATVDPNDPASVQRVADMARASQHAASSISDYTAKVCGVTLGTTIPPVTTIAPAAGTTP